MYGTGDVYFLESIKKNNAAVVPYFVKGRYGVNTCFFYEGSVYAVKKRDDGVYLRYCLADMDILDNLPDPLKQRSIFRHTLSNFLLGHSFCGNKKNENMYEWYENFINTTGFTFLPKKIEYLAEKQINEKIILEMLMKHSIKRDAILRPYETKLRFRINDILFSVGVVDGNTAYAYIIPPNILENPLYISVKVKDILHDDMGDYEFISKKDYYSLIEMGEFLPKSFWGTD